MRPFLPERCRFTLAELEVYSRGYYEALAAALRVMKPAAKRWEGRMKNQERPHLVETPANTPRAAPPADEARDPWLRPLLIAIVVGGAVFLAELIVLLGALIVEHVR